ncbi:MAG TPA: tRNA epoxyqueuosine(34) reductase QueG [Oceanobacillus sp.]|nr:tRNA epoxyqueuosine(34) reductase QueG [Oceanobacillus sp.]
MIFSTERLKSRAIELGFNRMGITPAEPSPNLDAYLRWIDAGMHGEMGYMARPDRQARRRDLNVILPGVRSLVVVALDYGDVLPQDVLTDPSRGRIASYAWGKDYHEILTPRLQTLADWLQVEIGGSFRAYVDTGAILERDHARLAGLGFVGKNTMLIHPRFGSKFFLGVLLTDIEFDECDSPLPKASMCGSCTRCLAACPTNAFPRPFVLDARRCISYLTIEYKGWIDRDLRPLMGNWVFGCDVCQDVCPFQRFAPGATDKTLLPVNLDRAAPLLLDLLALDDNGFRVRYGGTPLERAKRDKLVRNACVAAGNWGDEAAVPSLTRLLDDESPLVRGHAAWALARIIGEDVKPLLRTRIDREPDDEAKAEIAEILR